MYCSISEIMFLFSCLSEIKLIMFSSQVKSTIAKYPDSEKLFFILSTSNSGIFVKRN